MCNRADLIKTNIQPGVYDAYEKQIEELDETNTKLQKYINRLIELRKEKRERKCDVSSKFILFRSFT